MYWFACWFAVVVAQRLLELQLAKRNAERIVLAGGYEVGAEHYPWIVGFHVTFFTSMLIEFLVRQPAFTSWMLVPMFFFLLLQAARVWCIRSLGDYWNTRIYVIPGMKLVRRGPYRFVKHPNYLVVTFELLALPLLFGCFLSAAIFPLLNLWLLRKRIAVEERALRSSSV